MTSSDSLNTASHILFSAVPAWGHVRPFCVLAARLVLENDNVVVTLLLSPNLLDKAQAEISAEFRDRETQSRRRRVRVFSSYSSNAEDPFSLMGPLIQTYPAIYQALVENKPVSCSVTKTVFDAVSPPDVVVLDFFSHAQMLATRAITGRSVPIIAWLTGHVATSIRFWGPQSLGGYGDIERQIDEEVARTGSSRKEIGDRLYNFNKRTNGEVVKIVGLPDMYDWEYFPQNVSHISLLVWKSGLKEVDAVFVTSTFALENESINAVYVIGPLLPSGYGVVSENARGSTDTEEFLQRARVNYGDKSVTLISFGTVFWPTAQEYIEEAIEAFVEKDAPFILCYASPFAKISDDLIKKIQKSGIGLISKWFPQQYILNHPFMTHGGHNSVMESLGSGIPMICWPFEADQPAAAAHLSLNLKVAFELIEVRTSENGMKPLLRSGRRPSGTREAVGVEIRQVIGSCRGEKGQELRKNATILKAELSRAWERDGISRSELLRFSEKHNLQLL
ncbi:hypothetical protein CVT25_012532 [Psilocybe cyanescens]|uniref:UDP-glycosyltransferases domain-containing protein n=1 Tax=Psilocybe cyanescens TaxID=93625 RepID=A0A409XFT9_PSICY|nr:hypothetical protein CVT25_012532 [Psilocybe cyanescens]